MLIEISVLLASVLMGDGAGAPALPQKRDIPANFSTVICPDEAKGLQFIQDYITPNVNQTDINLDRFFEGLRVTGCHQDSGPLEIEAVLSRKPIIRGSALGHIFYRAKRPSGQTIFGIVDEIANNRMPRTPIEEWLSLQTQDGVLTPNRGEGRTYACRSPQAARTAIATLVRAKQARMGGSRLRLAKENAFRTGACVAAQGRFQVRTLHESVAIFFGRDAESIEEWTAVTALNGRGQVVGILHNASLF